MNDTGEENERPNVFASIGGNWKEIKPIDAVPCTFADEVEEVFETLNRLKAEVAGSLKVPKYFRCKSRKRFIKLLMANKFSKREAQGMAAVVYLAGWTWEEAWWRTWPLLVFR